MSEPKRYEIKHITDILAIPESRWDDFVKDLKAYHSFGRSLPRLFDEISKVGGFNTKSEVGTFTWIDDNKHDANVHIVSKVKGEENA